MFNNNGASGMLPYFQISRFIANISELAFAVTFTQHLCLSPASQICGVSTSDSAIK